MSTDRELLELAAKAAGITLYKEDVFTNGLTQQVNTNGVLCWNPRDDDGDALRLAASLGLTVHVHVHTIGVSQYGGAFGYPGGWVDRTLDDAADYRHAILRAAVAIGKAMP